MKELEWYLGVTYRNICQPATMADTTDIFPDTEMTTIITDTGVRRPNTDVEMTPPPNNINEAIRQKLSKKYVH